MDSFYIVKGLLSTEAVDKQNHIVRQDVLREALARWQETGNKDITVQFDPEHVVGKVIAIDYDGSSTNLITEITDPEIAESIKKAASRFTFSCLSDWALEANDATENNPFVLEKIHEICEITVVDSDAI